MSALASELPRVNGWSIARCAGDRTPDRAQRLLNHASWDTFATISVVRRFAVAGLAEAARRGRRGRRWEVRSAGSGSKGRRWYARAWLVTASARHHLLIRRHLRTGELAFHCCFVPGGQLLTKTRLIRAAGLRRPAEEDFAFSKDCFAHDQCQARLYTAIARHAVLVMAALAICAITAAHLKDRTDTQAPPPVRPDQPPPAEPGMIPLTIPEIKRLLAALTARPPAPVAGHPLGRLDPPPPGPLTMVPPTRQTRPPARIRPGQTVKCGCLTMGENRDPGPLVRLPRV